MVTYPGALKTVGIGFGIGYGHIPYTSALESVGMGTWHRPFKIYSFKTYTSAFESAEICTAYVAFSAGIGLEPI